MADNMSNSTKLQYTSIDELEKKNKIDFTGVDPSRVNQIYSIWRRMSDNFNKQGNDEMAYIFLKRWLDAVKWLKKSSDKDGKFVYARSTTDFQIFEAQTKLGSWRPTLEVRYFKSKKPNKLEHWKRMLDIRNQLNSKKSNNNEVIEISSDELEEENIDIQNEVIVENPVIDRSSKQTALMAYDPRSKEVLRFLKELNDRAKQKSQLANELYNLEYKRYLEREDSNSMVEEYLRPKIKFKNYELQVVHEMYLKIENEYKTYLKETDTIEFNPTDDQEKKNLELNLSLVNKEIEDTETKRKKLHDEFLKRKNKKKQIDSDVHKEPLKRDGASINSGLKGSYSTQNVLQDNQLPQQHEQHEQELQVEQHEQEQQESQQHEQELQEQQQQEPQQHQLEEQQQEPPHKRARHDNVRHPRRRQGRGAKARYKARQRAAQRLARKK